MYHLYLSISPSEAALNGEREALLAWCRKNKVKEYNIIEEKPRTDRFSPTVSSKTLSPIQCGDTVVITRLERLGRSLRMLSEVLSSIIGKGAAIYVIGEGILYEPSSAQTLALLERVRFAYDLDRKIRDQRSNEGAASEGTAHHGRPFGSKKSASKSVLYGKTERLEQMRGDGFTLDQIAKALGVSRGTVCNYLSAKKA